MNFWAASVNRNGLYVFQTEAERDAWIEANDGFAVDESQVDPDLRKVAW